MKRILISLDFILLLIFSMLYSIVEKGQDATIIWSCLVVFYFYFFKTISKPQRVFLNIKTFFKIELIFLIFYYILYFMPYQSLVLGYTSLESNSWIRGTTYLEYTNISILASTIGLIAFMMGIKIGSYLRHKRKNIQVMMITEKNGVEFLITILFTLIMLLVLFVYTGFNILFSGSYSTSDIGDSTSNGIYFLVTHFILIAIAFIVVFYVKFKKKNFAIWSLVAITLFWCLLLLIIGDRNNFFIIAICALAGYFTFIRSISRFSILVLIISGLWLYKVVESSRTLEDRNVGSIISTVIKGEVSALGESESSFSITTITSRACFAIVPSKHDFFYGKFKLIGIFGVIPYSRQLIVSKNDKFTASSKVLGDEILGSNAKWGVGSNIISDIYMDFGIVGVIVLMYFLGWFGGLVTRKAQHGFHYKWIILYILLLGLYAEIPRYSFDFPVKTIVWAWLFFILSEKFLKVKKITYYCK